jgi:branched-chain amino acid transport system permease protein
MLSVAFIGVIIERFAFRKVSGEKLNEIFISLGLIYIFQNVATLFWERNYNIRIPSPLEGLSVTSGEISIGYDRILAMVIVGATLVGLIC